MVAEVIAGVLILYTEQYYNIIMNSASFIIGKTYEGSMSKYTIAARTAKFVSFKNGDRHKVQIDSLTGGEKLIFKKYDRFSGSWGTEVLFAENEHEKMEALRQNGRA